MTIIQVPLDRVIPNPWQTRQGTPDPEYIKDLALNIAANGLLQNPAGRLVLNDKADATSVLDPTPYGGPASALTDEPESQVQLAFGHNRLAAFRWLYDLKDNSDIPGDFSHIPVEVNRLTDEQMADFAWSENEKRRDHTPLERALAIQKRMEHFDWTQQEIAEHLGISRSTVANALRLLNLPVDMQAALSSGSLTERQAMALLPLFDLGDEVLAMANNQYSYHSRPVDIIAEAMQGKSNSDRIREQVDYIYRERTKNLQDAEWKLNQLFPEGGQIYCGLCSTCDKRLASRNQCLDQACFAAKLIYTRRQYLDRASQASGIPVIDELKGGYPTDITGSHFDTIIGTGCENLRLVYYSSEKSSNSIDGHPHAKIVCDKRNLSCTCLKGLQMQTIKISDLRSSESDGEEDIDNLDEQFAARLCKQELKTGAEEVGRKRPEAPAPGSLSAAELEEIARQSRRARKDAFAHFESALDLLTERLTRDLINQAPGVLYAVDNGYWYPQHENLVLEKIYRSMARGLANRILPRNPDSVEDLERRINNILQALELEPIYLTKTLLEVFVDAASINDEGDSHETETA